MLERCPLLSPGHFCEALAEERREAARLREGIEALAVRTATWPEHISDELRNLLAGKE